MRKFFSERYSLSNSKENQPDDEASHQELKVDNQSKNDLKSVNMEQSITQLKKKINSEGDSDDDEISSINQYSQQQINSSVTSRDEDDSGQN